MARECVCNMARERCLCVIWLEKGVCNIARERCV